MRGEGGRSFIPASWRASPPQGARQWELASATWTLSPEPLPPSTGPPWWVRAWTRSSAPCSAFVLCLLVVLVLLMVRWVWVPLDPYSRMPASSWTDHKEALERGSSITRWSELCGAPGWPSAGSPLGGQI